MSEAAPHNAMFVVWVKGRILHQVIPKLARPVLYVATQAENRLEWATSHPHCAGGWAFDFLDPDGRSWRPDHPADAGGWPETVGAWDSKAELPRRPPRVFSRRAAAPPRAPP